MSAVVVTTFWCLAVLGALALTLDSYRETDFDGFNNALQLPLALPWVALPIAGILSNEGDAVVHAAMGLANAPILYLWILRGRFPFSRSRSGQRNNT